MAANAAVELDGDGGQVAGVDGAGVQLPGSANSAGGRRDATVARPATSEVTAHTAVDPRGERDHRLDDRIPRAGRRAVACPRQAGRRHAPGAHVPGSVGAHRADRHHHHACPHCGNEPTIRQQDLQQRADLAEVWLEPDPNGELIETHHCAACAPHRQVSDLACTVCGDGPLLVGADAGASAPAAITARARRWLTGHGWQIEPELTCPHHTLAR